MIYYYLPFSKETKLEDKKRILVVDDEAVLRDMFVEILKQAFGDRLIIEQAENFADAQRLLQEQKFDLLLSDVELPDGKGFDLVSDCMKIFMSGEMDDYKNLCWAAKKSLLSLKKPFKNEKLIGAIKYAFQWE